MIGITALTVLRTESCPLNISVSPVVYPDDVDTVESRTIQREFRRTVTGHGLMYEQPPAGGQLWLQVN
jgi:hypothetical protein